VQLELSPSQPINGKQLRRLHALWHRWAGGFALSREADRQLRHHYVELFTEGRAHETLELSECDAALVIEQLAKLTHQAETRLNQIAGTAAAQRGNQIDEQAGGKCSTARVHFDVCLRPHRQVL